MVSIPNFGNDLIRMFSDNWIIVAIAGVCLIMLGLVSCAKIGVVG